MGLSANLHLLDYFEKLAPKRVKMRNRNKYYWDEITEYCDYFINENSSVLEVGCGTGELINRVKGNRKLGVDYSAAMIKEAKNNFPNSDFKVMTAENIELDEKFDVIIISNLIGYLDDNSAK